MHVTFVVFTDSESCTRWISTNPGPMEVGKHGQMRGARFVAVCLEVVAVAGLMWVLRCVSRGEGVFLIFVSTIFFFSNSCTSTRPLAARDPDSSQRGLRAGAPTISQSSHRELAPTYPHQAYWLLCSHLRKMACHQLVYEQSSSHQPNQEPA